MNEETFQINDLITVIRKADYIYKIISKEKNGDVILEVMGDIEYPDSFKGRCITHKGNIYIDWNDIFEIYKKAELQQKEFEF